MAPARCRPSPAGPDLRRQAPAVAVRCRSPAETRRRRREAASPSVGNELQQVLVAKKVTARLESQTGGFSVTNDRLGIYSLADWRPRAKPVFFELYDPDPPSGLQGIADVAQQRARVVHLVIGLDDQHDVDGLREIGIDGSAEDGFDVLQSLAPKAAIDRSDHLGLDVLCVDQAVRPDPVRQPDGEPPTTCTEVSDDASFRDLEEVHDLIGALPCVPIRTLEQAEVLRREQPSVRALLRRLFL